MRTFCAAYAVIEAALLGTEIAVLGAGKYGTETDSALALSVVGRIGLRARCVRPATEGARPVARDAGVRSALDPLHGVALHVVESPGIREFTADGFRLLVGVIEIPEIVVVDFLAPVVVRAGSGAGGIFPLGFDRHACADGFTVGFRVIEAHEHDRLLVAQRKAGGPPVMGVAGLLGIGAIPGGFDEGAELGDGDLGLRHLERPIEFDALAREAFGARQRGVASHDERPRRNFDECRFLREGSRGKGGEQECSRHHTYASPSTRISSRLPLRSTVWARNGRGVCVFGQRRTLPSRANFAWPQQVQ